MTAQPLYERIAVQAPAGRTVQIVGKGRPIYGILVESLAAEPLALLVGDQTRDPLLISSGDFLDFNDNPQEDGLWALWPNSAGFEHRLTVVLFYSPWKFHARRQSVGDLALKVGGTITVTAAGGQRAAAAVMNYTPQDYALINTANVYLGPRLIKLDDLFFTSSIATLFRVTPVFTNLAFARPAPVAATSMWPIPVELGEPNIGLLVGGVDPTGPFGTNDFFGPFPIGAGEKVSLDDLDLDVESGYGVCVRLEDFAATLKVQSRHREHGASYPKASAQ